MTSLQGYFNRALFDNAQKQFTQNAFDYRCKHTFDSIITSYFLNLPFEIMINVKLLQLIEKN